ncbi:MAG: response regulator, partial [Clostridia bacterium]|nr:response regulator [Clostridia bacterium]
MSNILQNKMRAKMILAFALCLILVLSYFLSFNVVTAFADDTTLGNNTFKAGIFHMDGYHMKDTTEGSPTYGNLSGYGIDFLHLVAQYSNIKFLYTGYDKEWGDMLDMLRNGDIDVVTSASRTAEREEEFAYSLPMGRKQTVLSIRIDDAEHIRGDYNTYNGLKVGLLDGNTANELLEKFAKEKGFTYVTPTKEGGYITPTYDDDGKINESVNEQIKYYQDDAELATALQNGEIDAILTSDLRKTKNETTLDIIADNDFYAIVRRYLPNKTDANGDPIPDTNSQYLLYEINYAIRQMNINEGDWQNVLFYKYYSPDYSSNSFFTDRENNYLSKQKEITVTARGDRAPYSYVENGELKGILPDYFAQIMQLIAEKAKKTDTEETDVNISYRFIAPKDEEDYNRLINGGVDIVLDSAISESIKENADVSGFNTVSYLTARMAKVTRLDHTGDSTIVAVSDSQGRNHVEQTLRDVEFKSYDTGEQALQAVLDKKADVAYVYSYTAQYFINHGHTDSLYYSSVDGMVTPVSMHVNENTDHELVTILNKCINQMSDDVLNQLITKYISYTPEPLTFWEYLKEHPVILIVVFVVIALIACVILWLLLRGRMNKKMLHATERSNRKMAEQLAIVEALSRDYTNVYAINEERAAVRIIKLEGFITDGLKKDSAEEYDYQTVLEKYIASRVYHADRKSLTKALSLNTVSKKLKSGNKYMGNYRIQDSGEIHHYQYTFLKIEDKDEGHGDFILAGFRNIDDIIRNEQEQKEILEEALAQAQYANKAKTTFLNNMSHDIRTPMNAIIGFTSLASTHIDNKEQVRDYLGKIMTSGNHLLSLINDVLDMSRIESGKVKIEEKETSLPDVMHDLKTIVQSDVKSKQLEFYIDTLDVTNETIICDKLRLNQVLLNILSNAMKYTKPGGMVSVRVIQKADAQEGYASYEFRVKDTGIGMSPEFLQHVFEPFEREQTSTVSGIQGTGLGLAITKNIVDLMGGTITVESEVGKGSEFIVNFSFRIADTPVEPQRLEQLVDLRALVVDDDVNTCVSVSKMLSSIGMHPDWTTLGKEAIIRTKFALEQNEAYSAYIIDWLMPDMNGIELVRRIRKVIGDSAPVIILTAYDWTDIEKEAKEAGVTAFCSKPLFLSELRNVLAAPFMDQNTANQTEKEEPHFDGKRLLLVEDNELNQEIAKTILEEVGLTIDTADDGSIAVEQIKKMPAGTYDLILMDIQMPIMNGYQATQAIRALDDPA